jgi:hypothetical protein
MKSPAIVVPVPRWLIRTIRLSSSVILLAFLVCAVQRYRHQQNSYHKRLATLQDIEPLDPDTLAHIAGISTDTHWYEPERRMVQDILIEQFDYLPPASSFASNRPANQLAMTTTDDLLDLQSSDYLLALISGDLYAAFDVATKINPSSEARDTMMPILTDTLWQTAVEYLHELHFRGATQYTEIYLELSQHMLEGADNESELEPPRNRTLAHILQRELKSGRARSLCGSPGVQDSFGALLGGDWGTALPETDSPELAQRRKANAQSFCQNHQKIAPIPYEQLIGNGPLMSPIRGKAKNKLTLLR